MDQCLKDLERNDVKSHLRHVEEVHDRSVPKIEPDTRIGHWDKNSFLHEIETGVPLKHVDGRHDRSAPQIEEVHIQPSHRGELLSEVRAAGAHHAAVEEMKAKAERGGGPAAALAHVEGGAVADRSAPAVEGASLHRWDKGALLSEIAAPHELRHVEGAADRSAPAIEPGTQIRPSPHGELMSAIRHRGPEALRHVEDVADRSSPQVEKTAAMRISATH